MRAGALALRPAPICFSSHQACRRISPGGGSAHTTRAGHLYHLPRHGGDHWQVCEHWQVGARLFSDRLLSSGFAAEWRRLPTHVHTLARWRAVMQSTSGPLDQTIAIAIFHVIYQCGLHNPCVCTFILQQVTIRE